MTTLTLSNAFSFASDQDWAWEVTSSSASSLVISNGAYKQVFSGSFTYNDQGIVFGTVSSTSFYVNTALVYLVSGMSSNATQLQVFANTPGDTQETYAYVLQSNDTIIGSTGNDALLGFAGNDVIKGGLGNDTLNGGIGTDSAVFASNFAAASVQYSSATASFTVTTALDGVDTLTNIETLVFADQSVSAASLIAPPPTADDFLASALTTGRLSVGSSVSGTLESVDDKDWFAVSLVAGQQYVFKLDAAANGGLPDAYLYLYDDGGQLLGSDDDGGTGLGSSLGFTATSSGTHYLSAESGIYGAGTGAYSLSAIFSTPAPVSDTSAPTVASYSPADGGTGVDLVANIALTFNEAIQRGTGSMVLKTAAGVVIETFDAATSSRVSVSGSTLTIDPSVSLVAASTYNLSFSAGTVLDVAGNRFAGTTSYDFSTSCLAAGTGTASTTIKLVSANAAGVVADLGTNSGNNTAPALSADGRFVVFTSWGGNLVATDNNNPNETNNFNSDSFYKDMSSGAVQFVVTDEFGARSARMGSNSTILNPIPGGYPTGVSVAGEGYAMSADGRVVAFETSANNLVSLSYQGDPNSPTGGTINSTTITAGDINTGDDVYAKNLATGTLKLVSSNANGLSPGSMGGYVSSAAAVSADGSLVAFTSFNDGLLTGDTNRASDIFVKTLGSGAIARLSTTASGAQANGSSDQATFSADGHSLVFMS
ncbi:Ig-like domain-containing protein, partial [bacterium]|nr:Ig-like domain-containing protein [bacterium]